MVTPYVQHLKPVWHPLPYVVLAVVPIIGGVLVRCRFDHEFSISPEKFFLGKILSQNYGPMSN
jgi:hypothetical protein